MINFKRFRNPDIRKTMESSFDRTSRLYDLGTPILADDDKIVTITNMKNGDYVIAAQPDVARNLVVTATAVDANDTLGKITIVGTDINGLVITEEVIPVDGTPVSTTKAFLTVTKITGSGWAISGGNDTIIVGVGNKLGLPISVQDEEVVIAILGTALLYPAVSNSTVDLSAGTYDGSKKALVFIVE